MTSEEKLVPRLRFPGFEEEWEKCALGDFLTVGERTRKEVTSPDDLLVVRLNLGGVQVGSSRETLSFGSTAYYERSAGQFIYGKQNFFNGGFAIVPPEADGGATSGDVPALDIRGITPMFLYNYISREPYWRRSKSYATGTGSKRIHEGTLQKFPINVPGEEEQQAIVSFFKTLDDEIQAMEKKTNQLTRLKRGLLQQLFPQKREDRPRVRFPGFTDVWEQCSFDDVIRTQGYRDFIVRKKNLNEKGLYPVIQQGDVPIAGFTNKEPIHDFESTIIFGDHTLSIYKPTSPFLLATDGVKLITSDVINIDFVYVLLDKYKPNPDGYKRYYTTLRETPIRVTTYKEEQYLIGSLLQHFDRYITETNQKLTLLNQQKQALLQQLFI